MTEENESKFAENQHGSQRRTQGRREERPWIRAHLFPETTEPKDLISMAALTYPTTSFASETRTDRSKRKKEREFNEDGREQASSSRGRKEKLKVVELTTVHPRGRDSSPIHQAKLAKGS